MKTLDDAVSNQDLIDRRIIERNGLSGGVTHAVKIGDRAEIHVYAEYFDQRAKELGFINGYRWGVEYPTNGVQPDLPSDVIIRLSVSMCRGALSVFAGAAMYSAKGASFIITDERYKPQDTSYLDKSIYTPIKSADECLIEHVVHTKTTDTTIEFETGKVDDSFAFPAQDDSDWYDYEARKDLRLPPAGVECEVHFIGREFIDVYDGFTKVKINYVGSEILVFTDQFENEKSADVIDCRFRPLDHATRKAELEKKRVIESAMKSVAEINCLDPRAMQVKTIQELYNLGYLRMPTEKN
jgi:hypothetical protein